MGGAGAGCLAMMITITTSGGIGGFGLAKSAHVAVDSLPEPLRAEACALLDPSALGALDTKPAPGAADRIMYKIAIEGAGASSGTFRVPESALPAETLDLIDQLFEYGGAR